MNTILHTLAFAPWAGAFRLDKESGRGNPWTTAGGVHRQRDDMLKEMHFMIAFNHSTRGRAQCCRAGKGLLLTVVLLVGVASPVQADIVDDVPGDAWAAPLFAISTSWIAS